MEEEQVLSAEEAQPQQNESRKRSKAYTEAQKQIIIAEIDNDEQRRALLAEDERAKKRKLGYNAVLLKYPDMGFTESGLKDCMARYRKTGTL